MLKPAPGCNSSPTMRPMASASVETTSKYNKVLTPTRPTRRRSPIDEMPCTTVQKITGAIIILISAMKASPNGFICLARFGA